MKERVYEAFPHFRAYYKMRRHKAPKIYDSNIIGNNQVSVKKEPKKIKGFSHFGKYTLYEVPLIDKYAQSAYKELVNSNENLDVLSKIPYSYEGDKINHGDHVCFEVQGDLMDDGTRDSICDGDLALCREIKKNLWHKDLHTYKWNFLFIHETLGMTPGQIISHDVDSGLIKVKRLNIFCEDIMMNLSEVLRLYKITSIRRKL